MLTRCLVDGTRKLLISATSGGWQRVGDPKRWVLLSSKLICLLEASHEEAHTAMSLLLSLHVVCSVVSQYGALIQSSARRISEV